MKGKPVTVMLPRRLAALLCCGMLWAAFPAQSCDPNARVFFIRPYNGATVRSPFVVIFGAELV
ncbi:MAG: hypothetical protein WAU56_11020, partial [Steroidobacteraceae bacterium]